MPRYTCMQNVHLDYALLHLGARLHSPVLRYEGMHPSTSNTLRFFSVLVCILTQYNKRTILPASRFNRPSVILCPHSLFVHVCEFLCLVGGDAGVDDFLNVAVHDLVEFV